MPNYKAFGFGALVVSILLLIVIGHIYDMSEFYIPGWVGAVAVTARIVYIAYKRKNYTAANENINGGKCSDIQTYLQNTNDIDLDWCNLNKSDTDKTNLTRSANLKFHPNSNNNCSGDATKAFQTLDNACGKIIIERKNIQNQKTETSWWDDFWTSSNNYTDPTYTKPQSTYYTKTQTDYENMSYNDLRQSANVGDQYAYKEQANRRFRDSPVNVKSDPDARPDTDFCTIM